MKARDIMRIYDISRTTLYLWAKSGTIKYDLLPSGRYDYKTLEETDSSKIELRKNIIYARVSSSTQKADLPRQIERLQEYSIRAGIIIDSSYSEIASALNYNRKQYRKLYKEVTENKIGSIIIEHKDRLLRIGFADFEELCKIHNTKLIVVNLSAEVNKTKEIVDDMISIIHHFSARVYSNRRIKKIVEVLTAQDD